MDSRIISCSFCESLVRVYMDKPWGWGLPEPWMVRADTNVKLGTKVTFYWCGTCELPKNHKRKLKNKTTTKTHIG